MKPTARGTAAALLVAATLLLTGCSTPNRAPEFYSDPAHRTAGPVPAEAAQVAERFRRNGGEKAIKGVDSGAVAEGVPRITVWSSDTQSDNDHFNELRPAIETYLKEKEGWEAPDGYFLDIYGGDGTLLHRFDAR
ncbi:hypothetical protein [Streptomyces sp. NPDC051561]|uniref:hypothetical protein n=1 Tax=Streptomyces sp. NPDC051561 TaxID=3365658 RepID=UPI0037B4D5FE